MSEVKSCRWAQLRMLAAKASGTHADSAAYGALRRAIDATEILELTGIAAQCEEGLAREERLRMQLVACGVVAMSNTKESADKQREMHPDYKSASCEEVANAVDREMKLQQRLAEADKQRDAAQVWERFAGYLLDNCEGQTVYEESLQYWLSEMLRKERETSPGCSDGEKQP